MDLSAGRARPMPAAIKRCASRVEFSLMTVKATWPGLICFSPSLREINLQLGGKIEDTRTMLQAAMPALRNANSKLESRSRCFPTPFVRKIFFATNAMRGAEERCLLSCFPKTRELFNCACEKVTRTLRSVNQFPATTAKSCSGLDDKSEVSPHKIMREAGKRNRGDRDFAQKEMKILPLSRRRDSMPPGKVSKTVPAPGKGV